LFSSFYVFLLKLNPAVQEHTEEADTVVEEEEEQEDQSVILFIYIYMEHVAIGLFLHVLPLKTLLTKHQPHPILFLRR